MKHIFILLLLTSTITFAQEGKKSDFETRKNVIKISPIRAVVYKFNLEYERKLNSSFSLGAVSDIYYENFLDLNRTSNESKIQTIKNSIYTRVYPWGNGVKGFYVQAKVILAAQNNNYSIDSSLHKVVIDSMTYQRELISSSTIKKKSVSTVMGGSLGIGYQTLLGKQKRLSIDSKIEFQLLPPPYIENESYHTEEYYDKNDNFLYKEEYHFEENDSYRGLEWILFGPGALIYPSIKIGYLF